MNLNKLVELNIIVSTMLITPHTLVGIALGTTIQNPAVAVPLAFIMHFLGDLVPHWDFFSHTDREQKLRGWRPIAVMADLSLAIALGMFFVLYALWVVKSTDMAVNIFLCAVASVLPDVLEAPHIYMTPDKEPKITKLIYFFQHKMQFQAPLPWGIISQLGVMAFCLLLILSSIK